MELTERLKQCLEAGDVLSLFPLLATWTDEELRALVKDVEQLYQDSQSKLEEVHKRESFKLENFFNRERSKAVDQVFGEADLQVFAICAEISSVAQYYLERKA